MEAAEVFGRAAGEYDTVILFFRTFGERLVDFVGIAPGDRVLDLASGRGASVRPAVARGATVTATDLAPQMVDAMRADGLDAHVMDAAAPTGGPYDVILCAFGVMFLPDPAIALRNWRAVLRDGGRVGISVPTGANPEMMFFGEVAREFVPDATPPQGVADLAGELEAAGFIGIEERDDEADFVFPDEDAWWRWINSQGQRAFIERVAPERLAEFREACFERLRPHRTPDGYRLTQRARYTRCQSFHTGS